MKERKTIVLKALGDVDGLDAGLLEGVAVDDEFVCDEPVRVSVERFVVRRESAGHVVRTQNGDLRGPPHAVCPQQSDVGV